MVFLIKFIIRKLIKLKIKIRFSLSTQFKAYCYIFIIKLAVVYDYNNIEFNNNIFYLI